jgi:hypothetical protein
MGTSRSGEVDIRELSAELLIRKFVFINWHRAQKYMVIKEWFFDDYVDAVRYYFSGFVPSYDLSRESILNKIKANFNREVSRKEIAFRTTCEIVREHIKNEPEGWIKIPSYLTHAPLQVVEEAEVKDYLNSKIQISAFETCVPVLFALTIGLGLDIKTGRLWNLFLWPLCGFAFGLGLALRDLHTNHSLAKIFDEEK